MSNRLKVRGKAGKLFSIPVPVMEHDHGNRLFFVDTRVPGRGKLDTIFGLQRDLFGGRGSILRVILSEGLPGS